MPALSKSLLKAGLVCRLRLWNSIYRKDKASPPSAADRMRMDAGIEIGRLATNLFPGGEHAFEGGADYSAASARTAALMEDESVPAVFEATFSHGNSTVRADILRRTGSAGWDLIEVKSVTDIKKEDLLYDVWFQHHLLSQAGIRLDRLFLCHINKDYTLKAEGLNLAEFFALEDITDLVKAFDDILPQVIPEFESIIANSTTAPDIAPGKFCRGCEFFDYCTADKPKFWIFYLPRISEKKWSQLTDMGIEDIADIPDDFKLTANQKRVRDHTKSRAEYIGSNLSTGLAEVTYPLYFLDFETFSSPVPMYIGTHPYEALAFQWSCHVLHEDGELNHLEYIHGDDHDPREAFLTSLLTCLGESGTIIHYSHYEKTILNKLRDAFPAYSRKIENLFGRLFDLHKIIVDNYYHPEFIGSTGIKRVLPALVPGLSYNALDIQNGDSAALAYREAISPETAPERSRQIRRQLLDYCKMDTLAMYEVWRALKAKTTER